MKRLSTKNFIWIRKKYCSVCGEIFETTSKYSKICDKCKKLTGGLHPNTKQRNSHWKTFLKAHKITDKDLRRIRKNVKKEPERVPIIHGI